MNISYNWIKQFIDINLPASEISSMLTSSGLEVEAVEKFETIKGGLQGLVIGEVLSCEKHPNADKLSKTTVDVGNGVVLPIVCGAPNVAKGQKVVVATVGAVLYPTEGESFTIKKSKIRGEESEGMICAEDEIGLGKSHEGIMVLDTQLPNGTPAAKYFNLESDDIFVIGLTPNRVDAASHLGTARDIFAVLTERLNIACTIKKPEISELILTSDAPKNVKISIENEKDCPRYAGLVLDNITVKPSSAWLQNRLKSIGLQPINNVVDVTNYVLHELGQPLHAFDFEKIEGGEIKVKRASQDQPFTTLDGKERKLQHFDLTISNAHEPMCIAGVFGGQKSGVTESTKAIFLESAYFNPDTIRKTSQYHALKTDASFRYERGIDPNMAVFALKRALFLLQKECDAKVASGLNDIYPNPIYTFKVACKFKNIDRLSGLQLKAEKIFSILDALEISVSNESKEGFTAHVPVYRVDVTREADIVEEIVRIYGLDQIPDRPHLGADYLSDFPILGAEKIENAIAKMLSARGFNEIVTNSLTRPEYAKALGFEENSQIEILNKLSPELGVLRQSMLFSGLESVLYNINRKQKDIKFYEFGRTYHRIGSENKASDFKENKVLSIFLSGNTASESWQQKTSAAQLADLLNVVNNIFFTLNINDLAISKNEGKVEFKKGEKVIASALAVPSKWLKLAEIKQQVYYAELNFDLIVKYTTEKLKFKEIAKFPEVRRDLSLVIDKKVDFATIKAISLKTERKILKSMNVFDVYEGDKIDQNKKAYAISFILQDDSQTLTDVQIDATMQKLIKAYESELGALIRQ